MQPQTLLQKKQKSSGLKPELLALEQEARSSGYCKIAGVDEAGRGPLAGPVVAAACLLPEGLVFEGVDDSKKLSSKRRACLYEEISKHPEVDFSIAVIDSEQIDLLNILQATLLAMTQAVQGLRGDPDLILIDGNQTPKGLQSAKAIVGGDRKSYSIAIASILAKEARDRIMLEYHLQWPMYDFDRHKGYGTKAHREKIAEHGPCPIHRKSFEPIRSAFSSM